MSTIDKQGFLSDDAVAFVGVVRAKFPDLIEKFQRLSNFATRQIFEAELIERSKSERMAVLFWSNCLSNCQAAFILAERGAGFEALVIVRTALENFFFCVALIKKPEFIERLLGGPCKEMLKQAKEMLRHDDVALELSVEDRKKLEKVISELEVIDPKNAASVFEAAAAADLESLYHSKYRILSLGAVHASLVTAMASNQSEEVRVGPALDEVEEVFVSGVEFLEQGIIYIAGVIDSSYSGSDEVEVQS